MIVVLSYDPVWHKHQWPGYYLYFSPKLGQLVRGKISSTRVEDRNVSSAFAWKLNASTIVERTSTSKRPEMPISKSVLTKLQRCPTT